MERESQDGQAAGQTAEQAAAQAAGQAAAGPSPKRGNHPEQRSRAYRRMVDTWCSYDWANSAFATSVMASLFPPFFRSLAIAGGQSPSGATASWAFTTAAALALAAVAAPLIGAVADATGRVKGTLAAFAAVSMLATGLFATIPEDGWLFAACLFVIADLGFAGSIVLYESMLPRLFPRDDLDRVSARGYAAGYAGGGLLLALHVLMISTPGTFGMPDRAFALRAAFVSVAVWWALFSIPFFRGVPEPSRFAQGNGGLAQHARGPSHPFVRLKRTFSEIRRYRETFAFLLAYWLYSDGMGTIIKMATAYGDEMGISLADLAGALLLTQFIGVPAALLFGRVAHRWGARKALLSGLSVYVFVCAGASFMRSASHFYILAGVVGLVQGGCQALSRSLFAGMVPRRRAAEFFGFFTTSGRLAGIAGPLVFGLTGNLTGNSRFGILALAAFFLAGGALLMRVDFEAGARAARADENLPDP